VKTKCVRLLKHCLSAGDRLEGQSILRILGRV
jgi:hypothetical protein